MHPADRHRHRILPTLKASGRLLGYTSSVFGSAWAEPASGAIMTMSIQREEDPLGHGDPLPSRLTDDGEAPGRCSDAPDERVINSLLSRRSRLSDEVRAGRCERRGARNDEG